jgi:hypothetical protein
MGQDAFKKNPLGDFFHQTNGAAPYSRKKDGLKFDAAVV